MRAQTANAKTQVELAQYEYATKIDAIMDSLGPSTWWWLYAGRGNPNEATVNYS